jgi:LmbE family N-acetylglucosaminyl deacetylase
VSTAADHHRIWKEVPLGRLRDVVGDGTCVILAPHPDDESLGCGGLIAACVAAGQPPLVAVLTDGAGSHPNSRAYPPERLRTLREAEVQDAVACLGLSADRVVFLQQPDTAAPHKGPGFDTVVTRLVVLIRQEANCTAILAPWRHDPHCDHEAASKAAGAAAATTGIKEVAYPVWGWTLPGMAPIPGSPAAGWRLDISAFLPEKRAAIQAHRSQYGNLITDDPDGFRLPSALLSVFDSPYETFIPLMPQSRPPSHFQDLYQSNSDPWGFETSPYEQAKYQNSLKALGDRHFESGFEVGCSIGVLTQMLASRCGRLLGVDIVEAPLSAARARCANMPHVRFEQMQIPLDWPDEQFDLIVFSEILYFLSAVDIERCARRVVETLLPAGAVLLVSWTGKTDDPSSGDIAPDLFIEHVKDRLPVVHQERHTNYRLELLTAT